MVGLIDVQTQTQERFIGGFSLIVDDLVAAVCVQLGEGDKSGTK
jgi:hypothetical protein